MKGGVCERCWQQAVTESLARGVPVVDRYERLLEKNDCTPEQQAGQDALICMVCGRVTVHPATRNCRACYNVSPHPVQQ